MKYNLDYFMIILWYHNFKSLNSSWDNTYKYLSNSVSLVESLKPFANGLLSIFSFVIWKKGKRKFEYVFISHFCGVYTTSILYIIKKKKHHKAEN